MMMATVEIETESVRGEQTGKKFSHIYFPANTLDEEEGKANSDCLVSYFGAFMRKWHIFTIYYFISPHYFSNVQHSCKPLNNMIIVIIIIIHI